MNRYFAIRNIEKESETKMDWCQAQQEQRGRVDMRRYHGARDRAVYMLILTGKTAIRTILGPQYAKVKKAPKVADEEEAKALLSKILPK
jgi:hypothetical protein